MEFSWVGLQERMQQRYLARALPHLQRGYPHCIHSIFKYVRLHS